MQMQMQIEECDHKKYIRKTRNPDADGIDDVIFVDYKCCFCDHVLGTSSHCISADYMEVYDLKWGEREGIKSGPC